MRVEFKAFADDSVIGAKLDLDAARLSDLIARDAEFAIQDVVIVALDDGRTVTAPAAAISRADLMAVAAAGPRGDSARRIRTRLHPVRTRIGPYRIFGYLHTPPSAHRFSGAVRRTVVPLTTAIIRYRSGSRDVEEDFDALLLNGDRIGWLEEATNADLRIVDDLDAPARIGLRPKDMTGGLVS
jgi:hypothetical protein